MQVALYLKHFPAGAPLRDGPSIAVAGLASGLAQNGVRATVLCEGPARRSLRGERYDVECFEQPAPRCRFTLAPGLKRYVAERLASMRELFVLNGMFHPSVYAFGRWLRRLGAPYVVAPHGSYDKGVFRHNPHLKWPYWYLFERHLLERACAIQVLDARHAALLRALGIDTRVIATENGVTPESVPPESKLNWRCEGGPARLVYLGRIDAHYKGLDILVDALARAGKQRPCELALRGPDWGDQARLEKRARRAGIAGKVRFIGPVLDRTSPEIIADYDIFCLPSRFEAFGLSALEAMLAARVLLVSERAGIARHVEASGCGVTVAPTVDGVLTGLDQLLACRERWREMGMSGRRHALAHLNWGSIAGAALREYRRLI